MGFFSWNCKVCGHPMLCSMATEHKNGWMERVVVIQPNGSILRGYYDGYGRVNDVEIEFTYHTHEPECYHEHCWEKAGKPVKYTGGSRASADQGWFFDDGEHNIDPP